GLLHKTGMCTECAKKVYTTSVVGSRFKVKIIKVDRNKEKISLACIHYKSDTWEHAKIQHPVSTHAIGTAAAIVESGLIVKLDEAYGLVHVSDLTYMPDVGD